MTDVSGVLDANRSAVEALISAADRSGSAWTTPRAPGKWSPSQVVEHIALVLEESALAIEGAPAKFPKLPSLVRPLLRMFFFNRVLRNSGFPTAKTNKAFDPETGPASPAEARPRLENAVQEFVDACTVQASGGNRVHSTVFGDVSVADYARFQELHTLHHLKQMPAA